MGLGRTEQDETLPKTGGTTTTRPPPEGPNGLRCLLSAPHDKGITLLLHPASGGVTEARTGSKLNSPRLIAEANTSTTHIQTSPSKLGYREKATADRSADQVDGCGMGLLAL